MPPADEPGRRYRSPRHGEPDPRWGGPAAVTPVEDDPYGDVTAERPSVGRHGTPDDDGPYDALMELVPAKWLMGHAG